MFLIEVKCVMKDEHTRDNGKGCEWSNITGRLGSFVWSG